MLVSWKMKKTAGWLREVAGSDDRWGSCMSSRLGRPFPFSQMKESDWDALVFLFVISIFLGLAFLLFQFLLSHG